MDADATHNATSLEATTDQDLHGDGAEQHLVKAERDLRDDGRAGRRRSLHLHHTKVDQVANVWARRARVGEGVTPEHPLEGDHAGHRERLEHEGQTAFALGETAVEETDAWDDEPDEEGHDGHEDIVGFVAGVLLVDVDGGISAVATPGVGWVVLGLSTMSVMRAKYICLHALYTPPGST